MIRTARLVMRPARTGDVAAMHAVLSHPVAMRYWSTAPHREVAETEAWIASMIGAHARGESEDDEGRTEGHRGRVAQHGHSSNSSSQPHVARR